MISFLDLLQFLFNAAVRFPIFAFSISYNAGLLLEHDAETVVSKILQMFSELAGSSPNTHN